MKTSFFLLVMCGLLLTSVTSCKKTEDTPTPSGSTTNPGSTTNTTTAKSSAKSITKFSFAALNPAVEATISGNTISATVTAGTDITKLVPTITFSDKATVSPASGSAQDFSKLVIYTVTAEDGSAQAYTVTVTADKPVVASVCHVVSSTSTEGSGTTYELDAQNRLSKFITASSSSTATTTETYDADGYRTLEKTTYRYATSGKYNLQEQTTADTYANGRLVKTVFATTYVDPTVTGFGYTYEYSYDAQGTVNKVIYEGDETTTIVNGTVTGIVAKNYTYELDTRGFVTKKTAANGSYTLYKYNASGQQTSYENYSTKGVRTDYYLYEFGSTKVNLPTNPVGFKGRPVTIPSAYGTSGYPRIKYAYYSVDASGKETLVLQYLYDWQFNSQGNLEKMVLTQSGAVGSTTTTTTTYQYEGCK